MTARASTRTVTFTVPGHPGWSQTLDIDPQDLNRALAHEDVHLSGAEEKKLGDG